MPQSASIAPQPPADLQQLNAEQIGRYAVAIQSHLDELQRGLPTAIERHGDAKRDLDVLKAQINYCKTTLTNLQSLAKTARPIY